ncbi:MAG: hypothetical protein IJK56_08100 [Firmicutes bacterium]|nr:hypothetical protein [Bacillota bacterium]
MKKLTALLLAAVLVLVLSGCTVETLGDWGGIGGMKAGETSASETAEASKEAEDPQADDEDTAAPEVTDNTDPAEDEEGDPAEETDGEAGETNDETTGETEESSDEENESEESSDAAEEEGADESTDGSADESTDEPEGPSEEEVFAAFADVIAELEEQCGEGEIREPEEEEDPVMLWGVAVVRLIDMNKDGVQELYVACAEPGYVYLNRQYLYVYEDGEAVQALRAMITNDGTEIAPCTMIVDKEEAVYLGIGAPFNLDGKYVTVDLEEDELIRTDVEYQAGYMSEDDKFIFNGEEMTMNEFEAKQDEFLDGAEITTIYYLDMTEEEMNTVLEATQETIAQIRGE